jgi:two-component system response regulator NreC
MIKVFIVDDHAVLRTGLRLLFASQSDMEVVGEAVDGENAVEAIKVAAPDVVTLDLAMPGAGGLGILARLTRECPSARILALTMHDDPAYIKAVVAGGGFGYVTKTADESEVLGAVRAVGQGRRYFGASVNDMLVRTLLGGENPPSQTALGNLLSEREREVLSLIAQGYTNAQTADRLYLSTKTIETYRARLMTKLGITQRAQLVQHAMQMGLLTRPIDS